MSSGYILYVHGIRLHAAENPWKSARLRYRAEGNSKMATRSSRRSLPVKASPSITPWSPGQGSVATLSEKVYRAFKRDIIHAVYQPGEALSEKDLAERYKGSRTPVREAAVRLQNERLLRIVPNRGYFVAQITVQVLNDIYEFRSAVECAAAELAAHKPADPALFQKLSELSEITCHPDDRESCIRFIEADTLFHTSIARLSRNQMLLQAVSEARSQMERIMFAAIDINYYGEVPGARTPRDSQSDSRARSRARSTADVRAHRSIEG